ncbi:MAG: tyrosine-type recombinase/integrase [Lachnospiraceae bacterium]|nr:tyrosine-type recombinase/integrase [Lachnospiraceae bacterium]
MIPYFTCHHIRHTFCSRLCEAETNIKVIQTIMGHKDIQTTLDIYAEVTDKKKRSSLEQLFEDMKLF